jgi:hypothetical protein
MKKREKKNKCSITFELALEPIAIKPVLPKQTFAVRSGVIVLRTFRQRAVDAMTIVNLVLDKRRVVVLGVGSSTKSTAHALGAALIGVMAPLLTPSAQKGAGMGFGTCYTAIDHTTGNKLTYEQSCVDSTQGVMDIQPDGG